MFIRPQVLGLDEMVFGVLPIEFYWLGAGLELPCEGVDGPFRFQLLVDQGEGFATAQKSDITVVECGFFGDLAFGGKFRTCIRCVDGAGADGPFATAR